MGDRKIPDKADFHSHVKGYPLSEAIPKAQLDAEVMELRRLDQKPFLVRIFAYMKLGGPGFMGAAATLGAGTMTAAMLSGAQFGYKTLWISWVAMGSGLFMLAAMARFATKGSAPIVQLQENYHGWFIARILTCFLGLVCVAVIFNFGQVALGTELIASLANLSGFEFPRTHNWPLYTVLTAWLALNYGRGGCGVHLVESFMKLSLLLMVLSFAACLFVVGIDWSAAIKGLFVPWLPSGAQGIDLFIASSAAAIGVADWVLLNYAGITKGWGPSHERLARTDIVMGLVIPFLLISFLVISVFAGTLHGTGDVPGTAIGLSTALVPLLGDTIAQYAFMVGFLMVPITTTVALSILCAIGVHEIFNWKPDVRSWRWKVAVLLPQIALLGAWLPNPIIVIIVIAAFLSLTNNLVGWSMYLMLNDRKVLGEHRSKSYLWNVGILVQVTLLNSVAIMWVYNRIGLWG